MKINENVKNGKKYYTAKIYLGFDSVTGQQRITTVTGKTKREVEREAASKRIEFSNNGNTIIKKAIPKTFKELSELWLDEYKLEYDKPNTIKQRESILKIYLYPVLGDYKIDKITPYILNELVKTWVKNANKKTDKKIRNVGNGKHISNIANVLKQIFDYAVRMDLLGTNPMLKVKIPKIKCNQAKKEVEFLNKTESKAFIFALMTLEGSYEAENTKAFFYLLIMTGMRMSEALALKWSDLDFNQKFITINKTLNDSGNIQEEPKTKKSNRQIFLDDKTIKVLQGFKAYQLEKCLELGLSKTEFIFVHLLTGKVYRRQRMSDKLRIFLRDSNMKQFTPHILRHTCASMLIEAGANFKDIQVQLGHETIQTTMDTYGYLTAEKKQENANLLSQYLNS